MNNEETEVVEVPMFEGRPITGFEVILPRVVVGAQDQYRGGNLLRLVTEMRVGDVQYKDNGDGTWTEQRKLTWESVEVVAEFDPADQVLDGGSSSSTRVEEGDEDDLGVEFGRSGESWPDNVAKFPRKGEAVGE